MFYDPGDEMKNIFNRYNDIAVNSTVLSLLPYNTSLIPKSKGHNYDLALAKDSLQLVTSLTSIIQESASKASITLTDKSYRNQLNLAIRNNEETGLTGYLEFNEHGRRQNYSLTLTTITGSHTYLRGYWYSLPYVLNKRLTLFDEKHPRNRTSPFPLRGRVAKVVMIQERPFTMLKRDHMLKRGNAKYEGFAVDLIREVAQMLEFDYEIYLVNDGKFGNKMPNGEWNGMIGELLAGNATMSVAPLSINAQREEAVDFTKPFKTRYISVLMRIPRRDRSYFEFLNPLSPIVWICTLGAFVIVSIILYTLERIGRGKDKGGTDALQITVRESFWFIFGSLLQGNTDSTPCTIPGRILTSAWWFFALILISSYTANLAAFLTVKKINTPINSVTDLAQQTKIKYGTVKDSGVMSFFKNTNIEHFTKMWAQMSELDPDSMVDNTTEGFKKVKDEDYAFFWDTTVNKYQTIMDCNMMEIGPAFDPKGFGIGVPPGATYREELSMAILQLSDRGRLHEIETKWWDSQCPEISKVSTDETSELQIENVAGVFFILVGGIIVAAIVCLGEYFANALINASKMTRSGQTMNDRTRPKNVSSTLHDPAEKDSFI
ncbi:glutamate receptor 8 [Aplysia californica]|uniref:Glutamate receptor 8 n=1 Tax=Aplysia californica TaxID=6500 RepID=D2SLW1_APLCA|nr:glutamate receptor 8 [Aplysia californica]ACB05517.1 glutamate receptor 8 [Aplysia californica]